MPSVFPQALGAPQAPVMPPQGAPQLAPGGASPDMFAPWVDPNADQIARLQARMDAPQQPTFTPDQIKQRQDDNAKQYALGLLGQLSGNKDLGDVGGTVFKQALANRQPKYTDHGTYDPLTGEFNYSPDYIDERNLQQLNLVQNRSAQQFNNYTMNQQRVAERLQQERETRASSERNAAMIAGMGTLGGGSPQQIGSSPQGWPIFRGKSGPLFVYDTNGQAVPYLGGVAPKETNAAPTEDQGKAMGWFDQATKGAADMAAGLNLDPSAAKPTPLEAAVGALPKIGDTGANVVRSPARQMFLHGASAFSEAVLRAATGAGMNEQEIKQKVNELTPQLGDSPQVVAQKLSQQPMYLHALQARAGKAMTQGTQSAGPMPGAPAVGANPAAAMPAAAASDPFNLFGGH